MSREEKSSSCRRQLLEKNAASSAWISKQAFCVVNGVAPLVWKIYKSTNSVTALSENHFLNPDVSEQLGMTHSYSTPLPLPPSALPLQPSRPHQKATKIVY